MGDKRAVVYARVSTDDQADRGFSLSAQLEAGRAYAEAHGFDVVSEQVDDGISGALAFSERPAGSVAWAMLRNGQADALIVQNVDRLSRDVVDLLVTIRELLRAGVEAHCLDLGKVESEYDIMLVIRGWQGSDERAKIRERSARGKREKLAQGMVVAGRAAYGYDFSRDEKGRLLNFEIVPENAAIVRLIFQWYTEGDGENGPLSIHAITKRLSEAGVPTPRKRKTAGWEPSSISRMLKNPTYKGQWEYKAQAIDGRPAKTFIIEIPAIVDAATWEAAQVQRERNRRKSKRNAKRDYLLRGIVKCGCGYAMVGKSGVASGKRYASYWCNTAFHHGKDRACHEKAVRAEKLEAMVWGYFVGIITNPATFEKYLREAQALELEAQNPKRLELETVTALISEAEAEAVKIGDALTRARGIVAKTLDDKMIALNDRYERLTARQAELEAALTQKLTDEGIAAALCFASEVARGLEVVNARQKRRLLDLFDARVEVKDGRVLLSHSVQSAPIELQSSRQTQHNQGCLSHPHYITIELT